jgi:hypothetical protein
MRFLPPAPARLVRRHVALVALVLVSLVAAASSQIGTSARAQITAQINAHWRGAYDILVRPAGARLALEATGGLVEPNFVGLTGRRGGISLAELERIRGVVGVDLAAPIGWVGLISTPTTAPSIELTSYPPKPTLYSVVLSVVTSDGISERLVFSEVLKVLVAPPLKAGGPPIVVSDAGGVAILQLGPGKWAAEISAGHAIPQLQSPIIAVDPAAERQLLGSAGSFLDPLLAITDRDDLTVATTNPGVVLEGYDQGGQIAGMKQAGGAALSRPVLPVLVSSRAYAPVRISADVTQLGRPLDALPSLSEGDANAIESATELAGTGLTAIGQSTLDWSGTMRALRMNGIGVAWPGSQLVGSSVPAWVHGTFYRALLASRPRYAPAGSRPGSDRPAFEISPQGPVGPGGPLASGWTSVGSGATDLKIGLEQSYRELSEVTVPVAAGYTSQSPLDAPYVMAPVGEYDLNSVDLPHDPLEYVPYGAYDPPDAQRVADGKGRLTSATPMNPTLNPAGLLSMSPMGIVDLHAAELLRGSAPIDAIRIRVAGITGYGQEALAAVARVAAAITALGLDVDIVAASSPQAVDVFVPAYEVGQSPAADLGWVEEHWTTLGAAPRVDQGLSDINLALLFLAILGFGIVAATTELATATARSREAGILAAIGWRRRRIIRWQAAESAVAGVMSFALAVLVWLAVGAQDPIGLAAAVTGGLAFASFGLLGAWLAQPGSAGHRGLVPARRVLSVTGPRTYALRSILSRPARTLVVVVGGALTASIIAPAALLITQTTQRVGPTALATALSGSLAPYQFGLLACVGGAAFVCAAIMSRVDITSRRREMQILEATGWTSRDRLRVLDWARIYVALPAAVLAGIAAGLLAAPLLGPGANVTVSAGIGVGLGFAITLVAGRVGQLSLVVRL